MKLTSCGHDACGRGCCSGVSGATCTRGRHFRLGCSTTRNEATHKTSAATCSADDRSGRTCVSGTRLNREDFTLKYNADSFRVCILDGKYKSCLRHKKSDSFTGTSMMCTIPQQCSRSLGNNRTCIVSIHVTFFSPRPLLPPFLMRSFYCHQNNRQNESVTHSVRYSYHHHWYNAKQ